MQRAHSSTAAPLRRKCCRIPMRSICSAMTLRSTRPPAITTKRQVINETRKILDDPEIRVGVTCVRVPVLRAHAVAATLECERAISPHEARAWLAEAPGVRVVHDATHNYFPMPSDASGQDEVLVGRLRPDLSDPSGRSLALFAVGDQLRKGAALNAVQIAERLLS